jgi:hypothetical protein
LADGRKLTAVVILKRRPKALVKKKRGLTVSDAFKGNSTEEVKTKLNSMALVREQTENLNF